MGCIYEDNGTGECQMEKEGLENNLCVYSDDPDPSYGCDMYESDWT
jgi:hypothetical protein